MRESDLLAFEIALKDSDGAFTAHNEYGCRLRKQLFADGEMQETFHVVSDWGGTHSTAKASTRTRSNRKEFLWDALQKAAGERRSFRRRQTSTCIGLCER